MYRAINHVAIVESSTLVAYKRRNYDLFFFHVDYLWLIELCIMNMSYSVYLFVRKYILQTFERQMFYYLSRVFIRTYYQLASLKQTFYLSNAVKQRREICCTWLSAIKYKCVVIKQLKYLEVKYMVPMLLITFKIYKNTINN